MSKHRLFHGDALGCGGSWHLSASSGYDSRAAVGAWWEGVRLLQDSYCNVEIEWKLFLTHPASLEFTSLGRIWVQSVYSNWSCLTARPVMRKSLPVKMDFIPLKLLLLPFSHLSEGQDMPLSEAWCSWHAGNAGRERVSDSGWGFWLQLLYSTLGVPGNFCQLSASEQVAICLLKQMDSMFIFGFMFVVLAVG